MKQAVAGQMERAAEQADCAGSSSRGSVSESCSHCDQQTGVTSGASYQELLTYCEFQWLDPNPVTRNSTQLACPTSPQ